MTNTEYEAACITAASCYDRFEGEHRLKQYDEMIAQVEKTLARLQEARREIVNFYNLNKCHHVPDWDIDGECFCVDCGEKLL